MSSQDRLTRSPLKNLSSGNLLADGDRTIYWDADNQPASIVRGGTTTTFAYTGDGGRVKKQTGTTVIRYAGGLADHVTDGAQVKTITAGGLPVATRVVGGINPGIYYRHGDHLGGLQALTTASGQVVQRLTYKPYGETFSNTGSVDFEKHRFTGQEEDPETGLYYYHARYYNPVLGRFLSPDAIVPDPGDPQTLNRYSYVGNNPVNRLDPSGHSWLSSFFHSFVQALPIIIVGIVVGLVAAELLPALGPMFAAGSMATSAAAGAIGGATAGALGAAVNGGNIGMGALMGGIMGGIGGAVGGSLYGSLTKAGLSAYGAVVASATILGAAFGGASSAINGGNVLGGMLAGAVGGALVAGVMALPLLGLGSPAVTGQRSNDSEMMVAGKGVPGCPSAKQNFFNNLGDLFHQMAAASNTDPDFIAALSAHESGWLGPHAVELQNPFGLTNAGGNNLSFTSYQKAGDYWLYQAGRDHTGFAGIVQGQRTLEGFLGALRVGGYNQSSTWAPAITDVYRWSILPFKGICGF